MESLASMIPSDDHVQLLFLKHQFVDMNVAVMTFVAASRCGSTVRCWYPIAQAAKLDMSVVDPFAGSVN